MRIFNTYGPRMALDDGRVVSNFVSQALTNQPITIYGDGKQVGKGTIVTRSWRAAYSKQQQQQPVGSVSTEIPCGLVKDGSHPAGLSCCVLLCTVQTRSFQYVDDLIRGMVAVMEGDEIGPFNVGNPGEFTMLELAEVGAALLGSCLVGLMTSLLFA